MREVRQGFQLSAHGADRGASPLLASVLLAACGGSGPSSSDTTGAPPLTVPTTGPATPPSSTTASANTNANTTPSSSASGTPSSSTTPV